MGNGAATGCDLDDRKERSVNIWDDAFDMALGILLGAVSVLALIALTGCAPATRTICVTGEGAKVCEVMPSPWWAGETAATVAWAQGADGATSGTVTVTRDKRTINSLGLSAISAVAGYLAAGVP